jgi:hypothetical protein
VERDEKKRGGEGENEGGRGGREGGWKREGGEEGGGREGELSTIQFESPIHTSETSHTSHPHHAAPQPGGAPRVRQAGLVIQGARGRRVCGGRHAQGRMRRGGLGWGLLTG